MNWSVNHVLKSSRKSKCLEYRIWQSQIQHINTFMHSHFISILVFEISRVVVRFGYIVYIHVIQKSTFATPDFAIVYAWVTMMNKKIYFK